MNKENIDNEKQLKLLVLFVFHTINNRVHNFFNNCIFDDDNIDFIIIANGKHNINNIPKNIYDKKNVITFIRDNIGYDFQGWSEALITNNLYENYHNFIFLNSSVMGPYMESYGGYKWTDIYINGLNYNNIKLFGSTINTGCNQGTTNPLSMSHVQSYIFSMDKTTLKYLINCKIFSINNNANTYKEAIHNKEILMSRKIIENNWNIGSLMSYYKDVDFTFNDKKPEDYNISFLDDIMWNRFRNKIWTNNELVFIKGNRCQINKYNDIFGDPVPFKEKNLILEYIDKDLKHIHKSFKENEMIVCDNIETIKNAKYGFGKTYIDIKQELEKYIINKNIII
jgi:hypothetical protein